MLRKTGAISSAETVVYRTELTEKKFLKRLAVFICPAGEFLYDTETSVC